MADQQNAWDISSVAAPQPPAGRPKYSVDSADGVWFPRVPIYDSSAKVDISLLSSTPLQILSAIANVAYILGPPSLIVVNPTAYELVGFSGVLETTIIGASGSPVVDAVAPLGAGWAASQIHLKTRPGTNVLAAMYTTAPAAGVAYLWLPFTQAVLST